MRYSKKDRIRIGRSSEVQCSVPAEFEVQGVWIWCYKLLRVVPTMNNELLQTNESSADWEQVQGRCRVAIGQSSRCDVVRAKDGTTQLGSVISDVT